MEKKQKKQKVADYIIDKKTTKDGEK